MPTIYVENTLSSIFAITSAADGDRAALVNPVSGLLIGVWRYSVAIAASQGGIPGIWVPDGDIDFVAAAGADPFAGHYLADGPLAGHTFDSTLGWYAQGNDPPDLTGNMYWRLTSAGIDWADVNAVTWNVDQLFTGDATDRRYFHDWCYSPRLANWTYRAYFAFHPGSTYVQMLSGSSLANPQSVDPTDKRAPFGGFVEKKQGKSYKHGSVVHASQDRGAGVTGDAGTNPGDIFGANVTNGLFRWHTSYSAGTDAWSWSVRKMTIGFVEAS